MTETTAGQVFIMPVRKQPSELKIALVNRRVYIKLDEFLEKVGSIELSDTHSEVDRFGTILEVAPDCLFGYEIGDRVLVEFTCGRPINLMAYSMDNDVYRIAGEDEILGRILEE